MCVREREKCTGCWSWSISITGRKPLLLLSSLVYVLYFLLAVHARVVVSSCREFAMS